MAESTCSIVGCERPVKVKMRGWCGPHYERWQRHGDPLGFDPDRTSLVGRKFARLLVVAFDKGRGEWECRCDCGRTTYARRTWLTKGTKFSCGTPGPCRWRAKVVSYSGMHRRLERHRGAARDHDCVDCGDRAHHWSYDHSDPNGLVEVMRGIDVPYSLDLDKYVPRCRTCHRRYDLNRHATPEGVTG